MTNVIPTDKEIKDFLREAGQPEDEFDEWIDAYREDDPDGDYSFQDYYYDTQRQIRMFSSVDWDESDSEVSRQLSEAYASYL